MVLIVPCAGKSTRFGLSKPKFILTHPDGKLMIEKSLEGIDLSQFERVVITIVSDEVTGHDSEIILSQAFEINGADNKYELCILPGYTTSQSETVYQTILNANIQGSFAVKDSDNKIIVEECFEPGLNYIVGLNINKVLYSINRLTSKSFLKVNSQNIVTNIIEKKVISELICLGLYVFGDASKFVESYINIRKDKNKEIFISHVIAHQILNQDEIFYYVNTSLFEDYGTIEDWQIVQSNFKTFFIDYDGVIVKNSGKFGKYNWSNELKPIEKNIEKLKSLYNLGAQIVITTARPESYKHTIINLLGSYGIIAHSVICGLNHSQRVLINDFADTNPHPSAIGISIIRNGNLNDYI